MRMKGVHAMSVSESVGKKPVNLTLSAALVQESRQYCGNLSAKVEEMLQNYVLAERQSTHGTRPLALMPMGIPRFEAQSCRNMTFT